MIAIKIII